MILFRGLDVNIDGSHIALTSNHDVEIEANLLLLLHNLIDHCIQADGAWGME